MWLVGWIFCSSSASCGWHITRCALRKYIRCHDILICQPRMRRNTVICPHKTVTSQNWQLMLIEISRHTVCVTQIHTGCNNHKQKQNMCNLLSSAHGSICAAIALLLLICVYSGCLCWSNENHYCTDSALLFSYKLRNHQLVCSQHIQIRKIDERNKLSKFSQI